MIKNGIVLAVVVLSASPLFGSVLPKDYSLTLGERWRSYDDPDLARWIDDTASRPSVDTASADKLASFGQDAIAKIYAHIRHTRRRATMKEARDLAGPALAALENYRDEGSAPHPLEPYILRELTGIGLASAISARVVKLWDQSDIGVVPQKTTLGGVPALREARELRCARRGLTKQRMIQLAQRGKCDEARADAEAGAANVELFPSIDPFYAAMLEIGTCNKRFGLARRLELWRSFGKALAKRFGKSGLARAMLEEGYTYWAHDRFDEARKWVGEAISAAAQVGDQVAWAKGLLTLARIDENQGFYPAAIEGYKEFARRFPTHEFASEALSAAIILEAGSGNWQGVLPLAERVIFFQRQLPADERDIGSYGLALFWAGRALIETGEVLFGLERWKALVTDGFSTYYGALAHYMLERYTEKSYVVQPFQRNRFEDRMLTEPFLATDRQAVERGLHLLDLGLVDEARCEFATIDVTEGNEGQRLAKALLLHVTGDWLASIKLYGELPRSFRHSLPYGMERLLFPRRFEGQVELYSQKLSIDPALTMSLIRQESVFDPMALSTAGAQGLMQLLPTTAKAEANRLTPLYVQTGLEQSMRAEIGRTKFLYQPEVNLALGIQYLARLFKRFDNPVMTLSAYNAGPSVAQEWAQRFPTHDLLYFIERIPYKETRNYVKLILRNYFYYKKWYGKPGDSLTHLEAVLERHFSGKAGASALGIY